MFYSKVNKNTEKRNNNLFFIANFTKSKYLEKKVLMKTKKKYNFET